MKRSLVSVGILCLLVHSSFGFSALGHMVVARIAQFRLEDSDIGNKAFEWSNSLLEPFTFYCGEKGYPFVEASTWPDKIKIMGWEHFNEWHFKDQAVIESGYVPPKQMEDRNQNAVWGINQITAFLSNKNEDTVGMSQSILGKSLSLRQLIHFIGDIHQPLHIGTHVSEQHPTGDRGGNDFIVIFKGVKSNLHHYWDELFFKAAEIKIDNPMNEIQWSALTLFSADIIRLYSYDSLLEQMTTNNTVEKWTDESFQLASSYCFKNIEEGKAISEEYANGAIEILNKRLALAGYRLADKMIEIYQQFKSQ